METTVESAVTFESLKGESPWRRLASYLNRQWVRCLALILLGVAVHIPSLQGEFLWDDVVLVRDNPLIKSPVLILESFRHYLFSDSLSEHYRPVQTISYIFDYWIWNMEPFGFHFSNTLWHVLSGVLLYFLLSRVLASLTELSPKGNGWKAEWASPSGAAFVVSLLWLVHPVHSAAVDYVSGRADSLVFSFAAGAWLLFLRARDDAGGWVRRILFAVSILFALFALCSRETGCLWLIVFLLYLFAFDRKANRRNKMLILSACLVVVALYAGLRQLPERHEEPVRMTSWTPATRVVLMVRALGDYGCLMVFPSNLHVERSVVEPPSAHHALDWYSRVNVERLSIAGLFVLGAFTFGLLRKGPGQNIRIFGATWFLLTYLPVSNLFDLNATVAEHWLYLPSVGFLLFVCGCLLEMPERIGRYAAGVATVAVVALGARSAIRSSDWADPETFFRRTFASGGSNSRIGVNLAVIYAMRGEHSKAEAVLRRVLEVSPSFSLARNNLGIALAQQGKIKEAEAMFAAAAAAPGLTTGGYPRTPEAARNLARLSHEANNDAAALSILEKAIQDYPGTWNLVSFDAQLQHKLHGPEAALAIVSEFVNDHWWHAGASIVLGRLFVEVGNLPKAEAAFQRASMLDVHSAEALNLIALLNLHQNNLEKAYQIQQRAVSRRSDQPQQYLLLSNILERMGRTDEARLAAVRVGDLKALAEAQSE